MYVQLRNNHGDIKYSIGNIVDNIVITMYGARQIRKYQGDHYAKYIIV